jgi:predicted Zn-dependent peptidase
MKRILFFLFFIQGVIMGAVVENIEVKGVNVPYIYEINKNLPTVNLQIIFQNSGNVKSTIPGLSSIVAKMLNEGTKTLGSVEFAKKLESRAIDLSAQNGNETFVLEINCLSSELEYAIDMLDELISDPNFTKKAYDKVANVTLGGLMQKQSDFDYIAGKNLKAMLFKDTVLQNPSSGTIESIKEIKIKDIKNFAKEHFILSNIIVLAGGDIDKDKLFKKVEKTISKFPVGEAKPLANFEVAKKADEKIEYEETQQAYVYFGSPYFLGVKDEDVYISKVANFILGSSGFGSRLMEEIRVKRGLAYSAYSRATINKSHSYFSGYLQTKLESKDEAIKIVKDIIKEFTINGATQKELDGAKKFILGSEPLRNETLSQRLTRTFMEYYKGLEIGKEVKDLEKIENLSLEDLNNFIKKHTEINDLSFSIVTKKEEEKK